MLLYHNFRQFFETVFCSLATQAASLHKLESESSAAGRKLEEAVMRGGKMNFNDKNFCGVVEIYRFVLYKAKVVSYPFWP